MRDFQRCRGQRVGVDREVVVLARDFDVSRFEVLHGVVASAVAELQLVDSGTVRLRYELVAHAYSEDRELALQSVDRLRDVLQVFRVAGTVREEDSRGSEFQYVID